MNIFNRVFALRLVIVYQGLVRIPENKKIRFYKFESQISIFCLLKHTFELLVNCKKTLESAIVL